MSLPQPFQLLALDNSGAPLNLSGGGVCYNSLGSLAVYPSGQVVACFAAELASLATDNLFIPPVDTYDDDLEEN